MFCFVCLFNLQLDFWVLVETLLSCLLFCLFDVLTCANYLLPRDGPVDSYFCLMFSITEEGTPPAGEVGPAHERLALHILHTFNLVPEHIETRSLYSPVQPDIEQVRQSEW